MTQNNHTEIMVRRITHRERLLLYLHGKDIFVSDEGFVFAQPDITQEGIAMALGIGRNNVFRLLKPLIEEGYVKEWKARVSGYPHLRRAYTLTQKGVRYAHRIRKNQKGGSS